MTPEKKKLGVSAHVQGQQPPQFAELHMHINDEAVPNGVKTRWRDPARRILRARNRDRVLEQSAFANMDSECNSLDW